MKVLVGLSGGVDSAVAAYLLKQQGHDVTCCFMRNWDSLANLDIKGNPTIKDEMCPQEVDYQDAVKVAKALDLPLLRVDFIKEYWDEVFVEFLDQFEKGRTPNPDILCNKYIKFEAFYNFAKSKGFDYVATGHYAKIVEKDNNHFIAKAKDLNKDQSYFLAQVKKEYLSDVIFPLGDLEKDQVREIAEENNLVVYDKKDSTGICFIGERNFKEFLQNYLPAKTGNIVDISTKKVLKTHDGVLYYTIGQRKGLGIGGNMGPWFTIGKDITKNELYVSNVDDSYWLDSTSCLVKGINWYSEKKENIKCQAKFRYRQKDNLVNLEFVGDDIVVHFDEKIKSITPGQQAVFYSGDVVIGAGEIDEAYFNNVSLSERIKKALR